MKRDVAALMVGLLALAVGVGTLASGLGVPLGPVGILAPLTLITIGVVGLVASRRNHNP